MTAGRSSVVAVYAPKGGVGRTTLAFNLAVALAGQGRKTCLVDACFQFGDLRSLLKVPADAPSILDLPTDRIGEADLADVLWRDPSRIDILLAPSRVELAEMISARDVEKVLSLLRRVYEAVVIDLPATLGDVTLAVLDVADTILEIVTYDSTTLRNTQAVSDAFRAIGYAADQDPLRGQPGGFGGRDEARGPGPRPRSGTGAHDRVRRPARRPGQQRGRAVRAREPGCPGEPRRHGGRLRDHEGTGPGGRAALSRWPIRVRSASSTPASAG